MTGAWIRAVGPGLPLIAPGDIMFRTAQGAVHDDFVIFFGFLDALRLSRARIRIDGKRDDHGGVSADGPR